MPPKNVDKLIAAASQQFIEQAWIFRFPNVVGPRTTHGVIYDFVRKLQANCRSLQVLGDGTQEKPYLHVSELVAAMLHCRARSHEKINCFNIGVSDSATTVRYIAEKVISMVSPAAEIQYGQGNRGWVGDVPRFRYSTRKLNALGFTPQLTSNQAVDLAINEITKEFLAREHP